VRNDGLTRNDFTTQKRLGKKREGEAMGLTEKPKKKKRMSKPQVVLNGEFLEGQR